MDIFDLIPILGEGYQDIKNSKSNDPLEIFFNGFTKMKKSMDALFDKEKEEYNDKRNKRLREYEKWLLE